MKKSTLQKSSKANLDQAQQEQMNDLANLRNVQFGQSHANLLEAGMISNQQSLMNNSLGQNRSNSQIGLLSKQNIDCQLLADTDKQDIDHDDDQYNELDNFKMGDDSMSDNSSDLGLSKGSVTRKLSKIEKKISRGDLSKRERRLLQNRKSALKCRIKKQDQLERLKGIVDRLSGENRSLKEKISALNALLTCKNEENESINKKYSQLQFQQTLILASYLTQNGVNIENLPRELGNQVAQDALNGLVENQSGKSLAEFASYQQKPSGGEAKQGDNQIASQVQQHLLAMEKNKLIEAAGSGSIQQILNSQANNIQSSVAKNSILGQLGGINSLSQNQLAANLGGLTGSFGQMTNTSTQNNFGLIKSSSIENMENPQNLPKSLQQQLLQLKSLKQMNHSHANLTGMEQVANKPQDSKQDLVNKVTKANAKSRINILEHVNSFNQINQEDDVDKIEDGPNMTDQQAENLHNPNDTDISPMALMDKADNIFSNRPSQLDQSKQTILNQLLQKMKGAQESQSQVNNYPKSNIGDLLSLQQKQQQILQQQVRNQIHYPQSSQLQSQMRGSQLQATQLQQNGFGDHSTALKDQQAYAQLLQMINQNRQSEAQKVESQGQPMEMQNDQEQILKQLLMIRQQQRSTSNQPMTQQNEKPKPQDFFQERSEQH